jgi:YbgC/YbaW family acyl-CoA thioester hydrolase
MARIRIELPERFPFSCSIPVRITDINYGGHVGNDTILSIIHEARMQYLRSLGYSELSFAGVALIMADVGIEYKHESFYGDTIMCEVAVTEHSKVSFDVVYRMSIIKDNKKVVVALAKTGMVCYNYDKKKVVAIPEEALEKFRY